MLFVAHFDLLVRLLAGAIWIGVVSFMRLSKRKSRSYLIFWTLFYLYIFKVLDYTLIQYQSLLLLKHFVPGLMLNGQADGERLNLIPLLTLGPEEFKTSLLNVLMLLPFGFGLPVISALRMKQVVAAGASFSLGIELLQLVTGEVGGVTFRIADVNDVIFNTAGAAIGYAVFLGVLRLYRRVLRTRTRAVPPFLRYLAERPQLDP